MNKTVIKKLLQDPRVVDEINRHKWIQSEKAGYDIGFEVAKDDWVRNFSEDWTRLNASQSTRIAKTPKTRQRARKSE